MKMVQEETRKGPWTEQEDILLVNFVHLFGDRRWDFIAKVSGLNRTGKSCRLRWVNYLHPGLKRGKMTSQEEHLVLELHTKWGNRWSKIARRLPGRTDNEIKNYWRTHMRKKAQKLKRTTTSSVSCSSSTTTVDSGKTSFYDTGGSQIVSMGKKKSEDEEAKGKGKGKGYENGYTMDDIWKDIDFSEGDIMKPDRSTSSYAETSCNLVSPRLTSPPSWEYSWESLWNMTEDETKMFLPPNQFLQSDMGGDHLFG